MVRIEDTLLTENEAESMLAKLGKRCTSLRQEDGGLVNQVYYAGTDDGEEVVIKVFNPRWEKRRTLTEVESLRYVRENTSIPVPEIFAYDADAGEYGFEYIIMEKLEGEPLSKNYHLMGRKKRRKYLEQLADFYCQLSDVTFDRIGSFQKGMAIGPISLHRSIHGIGPFDDYSSYMAARMDSSISAIASEERFEKYLEPLERFKQEFILPYDEEVPIVLTHGDLKLGNILVDDGTITGVIDWEVSRAAPIDDDWGYLECLPKKDFEYFLAELRSRGKDIPIGFDERRSFLDLISTLSWMACYEDWIAGDEKCRERFVQEQCRKLKGILSNYGCM